MSAYQPPRMDNSISFVIVMAIVALLLLAIYGGADPYTAYSIVLIVALFIGGPTIAKFFIKWR